MNGTTGEQWRPVTVPGFERSHEVSSLGAVRTVAGRILAQYSDEFCFGYLRVTLCHKGRKKIGRVHRLVAEAFLGPIPPGMETLHGPGGKFDNRLVNLSYGTHKKNINDKDRDGTALLGERCNGAKLTDPQIFEIRSAHAAGVSQPELAKRYGVVQSNISRIVNGRTWLHVSVQADEGVA